MSLAAKLAVQANTRRVGGDRGRPRNSGGAPILEAHTQAITAPTSQCNPVNRTRVVRGVNGQAMKCGPKANGCKPGCSGTPLCACGAPCDLDGRRPPVGAGRRDIGATALHRLARDARTGGNRLIKNPCSTYGRESGQHVTAGDTMAQLRSEAACTAGISGTADSESQNCAASLLQGRLCNDLGGNVGSVTSGERRHARECAALNVPSATPGYEHVQPSKEKLCRLRLPTVKRTGPLSGSELIQMTADCERRAQQVQWNTLYQCPIGTDVVVSDPGETTFLGSSYTVRIEGPLTKADVDAADAIIRAQQAARGDPVVGIIGVEIGTLVTSIGEIGDTQGAFQGMSGFETVTFKDPANSLCSTIGTNAFSRCTSLSSVTIPTSVTSIGGGAFANCIRLPSFTIPTSVISIGAEAFFGCTILSSVTIPTSVNSIVDWAFAHCTRLSSVTIPSSVTSIGGGIFYGCARLSSVTIENGITSIGNFFFTHCTSLSAITIPTSVGSIGTDAFKRCTSLSSVTIPTSVTSIEGGAFEDCTSLSSVTFSASGPVLTTTTGVQPFPSATTLSDGSRVLSDFGSGGAGEFLSIVRTSAVTFS